MKTSVVIFLVLFFSQVFDKPVQDYAINLKEPKILLEKDYAYWKELNIYQQTELILQIMNLSDNSIKFQIKNLKDILDHYDENIYSQMETQLENVRKCMDNKGWIYYISYENDLQIGTLLLQCMYEEKMFNDRF